MLLDLGSASGRRSLLFVRCMETGCCTTDSLLSGARGGARDSVFKLE